MAALPVFNGQRARPVLNVTTQPGSLKTRAF